jgi:hypothetical protein
VIVHDVGSKTAGLSLADDSGSEVRTGIVIDGPTDMAAAVDETAGVAGGVASTRTDADAVDGVNAGDVEDADAEDADADAEGADGSGVGEVDVVGVGEIAAFLLPACLPTKYAAMQSPIRITDPRMARFRLRDGVIELTCPLI